MIKVVITRNTKGSITAFDINGHADYADEGLDIICSAVSVTAYTAAGALEDLAGIKQCYRESDGHLTITLPQEMTDMQKTTVGIILETTAIGFKQIELSYGKYVSVVEKEV
ncbi:MAG TPA: ribosomal-processing cysteine protease Prp [Clostridia bacterium]|nr:ribosomal-processing cysteine protease Prp [Clostridia bacterium]